jgi:hypothetical protein
MMDIEIEREKTPEHFAKKNDAIAKRLRNNIKLKIPCVFLKFNDNIHTTIIINLTLPRQSYIE